jgi:solute carrier family 25 carnitine/acylcarnitine transporter 20/29
MGDSPILHKMIKGTLCGFVLWGSMYPIDVIKTIIQGTPIENKQKKYTEYIKEIYTKHGAKGFYKGFYLTMFRAIPVNIGIVTAIDLFS